MRRLTVLCGLVALTIGLLTPAQAATPGAFTPAQASALCEAFFGVGAVRSRCRRVSGTCDASMPAPPPTPRPPAPA